jgi:hypothetical protein
MLEPGPVTLRGKVIEKNSAGVAVEFQVGKTQTYKVVIPAGAGAPEGKVGSETTVEAELLSIVDTHDRQDPDLGDTVAHVKCAGLEFYAALEAVKALSSPAEDEPGPPTRRSR